MNTNSNEGLSVLVIGPATLQNALLVQYVSSFARGHCEAHILDDLEVKRLESTLAALPNRKTVIMTDAGAIPAESVVDLLLCDLSNCGWCRLVFFNVGDGLLLDALTRSSRVYGLFRKTMPSDEVLRGLRALVNDQRWKCVDQRLIRAPLGDFAASLFEKDDLTDREVQIIRLLATGAKNRDIASRLFVSTHTVKSHIYNIYRKLKVGNRIEAVNWANRYLL